MTAFDKAFEEVKVLAEKFQNNHPYFTRPEYQEAEARMHFINPFFEALGWDVTSKHHPNPYEQEVKVEKTQKQQQSKAQKRADYAFYLAPNFKDVKFFTEAKKPSVELKHPDNYFQTIRYGWNANTPIAVLTDFEQFHIIDCRYKPDIRYVFNAKHIEYRFTDYTVKEKFAEIYWLFSREAVLNNSLQKFADSLPKPKVKAAQKAALKTGYQAIDDSFLGYIDNIREDLAKAFKKNNESLGSEALTEVVTRTVDRLVFIRFLEDKLIEPDNHVSEWRSWKDFITDCRKLDAKYNGVVFKEHSLLDKKSFVGAEEKMFLNICSDISNLNSPYDFNYIPIHILGSIYERFLGKVVVATEHRARIEEKPEVRKAGGVYYTPKYIVDYIVKNTIGEIIKDKTPRQIAELRFADIACGSGSFLIGVYDYLLDYHKNYYLKKYGDRKEPLDARNEDHGNVEYKDGQWILTLKLKQEILQNNIYGVDIDRQAVEVTQLSLFLKMLEEETTFSTQVRQGSFFSKVLPDLSKNIVCGNSLIGTDILTGQLFSFEDEKKLNPMDYDTAFLAIMKNGGFDAIVGNPPYIPIEIFSDYEKKYYQINFPEFKRKFDSSVIFISKALSILNIKGLLGYISSQTWETGENYSEFRRKIFSNYGCVQIINLPFDIFKDAYVDTGIFIFSKKSQRKYKIYRYAKKEKIDSISELPFELIESSILSEPEYKIIFSTDINRIIQKLNSKESISLGKITISTQGLSGSRFKETNNLNDKWTLPFYNATVKRYLFVPDNCYNVSLKDLQSLFQFYERKEKILIRRIVNRQDRLDATYYNEAAVFKKDLNPFILKEPGIDIKYILALINSRLFSWIYLNSSSIATKDDFRQTTLAELRKLPVKIISEKNKSLYDQLVTIVSQMLEAKKQLQQTKTEGDKTFLENKCASLDKQIDSLVYQLYELTEEEIKIVEGK